MLISDRQIENVLAPAAYWSTADEEIR